jgi:hypothetical protein
MKKIIFIATLLVAITEINAQITAVITQVKHRLSMLSVVNEIYPTIARETQSTTNTITTKNTTPALAYDINIAKTGRKVTINGSITNTTDSIIASISPDSNFFFNITNSEFAPSTLEIHPFFAFGTGFNTYVYFDSNKLYCREIPANEIAYFSITYFNLEITINLFHGGLNPNMLLKKNQTT